MISAMKTLGLCGCVIAPSFSPAAAVGAAGKCDRTHRQPDSGLVCRRKWRRLRGEPLQLQAPGLWRQRVETNDPADNDAWELTPGVPVRDGNGELPCHLHQDQHHVQLRPVADIRRQHVCLCGFDPNSSAGWMPLSSIKEPRHLPARSDNVSAKGSRAGVEMAATQCVTGTIRRWSLKGRL